VVDLSLETVAVAAIVGLAAVFVLVKATGNMRRLGRMARSTAAPRCGGCTLCPGPDSREACVPKAPPAGS